MSRIGKQPIIIPDKVEAAIDGTEVKVKGPLGDLSLNVPDSLKVSKDDSSIKIEMVKKRSEIKAMWGLYRSLLSNMVKGVSEGFKKSLEVEGVGYRAEVKGEDLELKLGYSHPIIMKIPEGLNAEVEKSKITISGIDRQKVGQFAAEIRSKRKPEPYKGKGIRYEDEHVRRKAGKRAAGTE